MGGQEKALLPPCAPGGQSGDAKTFDIILNAVVHRKMFIGREATGLSVRPSRQKCLLRFFS